LANVTATTAEKFIDDVWAKELNRAIEFDIVIASHFKDRTSEMAGHGDTFHLVNRHNLTANTKSASVAATPEAITETEQTFQPTTHQIVAQEIEDFAEVMSRYNIRSEYTMAASYALARAMDVAAAALLDDNTIQTVGTLTAELSNDNLIRAWQYLRDSAAKAPFIGVVSPATWAGLLKIEQFTNQLYNGDTGGKAVHEAQIGKVYQATFYQSQLTVGTAPNSSGHMWSEGHFFKIIKKAPKQDALFLPLDKAWVIATDQIYGVFEREEADEGAALTTDNKLWGVRLQSLK
jgi:hypothetical protein